MFCIMQNWHIVHARYHTKNQNLLTRGRTALGTIFTLINVWEWIRLTWETTVKRNAPYYLPPDGAEKIVPKYVRRRGLRVAKMRSIFTFGVFEVMSINGRQKLNKLHYILHSYIHGCFNLCDKLPQWGLRARDKIGVWVVLAFLGEKRSSKLLVETNDSGRLGLTSLVDRKHNRVHWSAGNDIVSLGRATTFMV